MKKFFTIIFALLLTFSLSITALATEGGNNSSVDTFDPALKIATSADGKVITVTVNDLPEGLLAELVIPCDGWSGAVVKDSGGKTIASTFGEVDVDPDEETTEKVTAVTFEAVGGTYTITRVASTERSSTGDSSGETFSATSKNIVSQIKSAQKGETVTAELGSTNKLDAGVLDALRSNSGVALQLTQNGKVVLEIPAGAALANEPGRIYYTLAELQKLYSQPLEAEVPAAETPAAAEAESAQPEQTEQSAAPEDPADAAAEAPVAEPEKEIDEQEASAAEKVEEEARSGGSSVVIGLVVVAAVALAAILIVLFKKKQEEE